MAAQIPGSFQTPVLGYIFDTENGAVRPISGIVGNSRIGAVLPLPTKVDKIAFFPDQRHAIASSRENSEVLVLDLREGKTVRIVGASSALTLLQISPDGSAAALYYGVGERLLIVSGLPSSPVIQASIDLSFEGYPLSRMAVDNGGTSVLLSFSLPEQDKVYAWTNSSGARYVMAVSRLSDMTFLGDDAIVLDSGKDQALLIRNVREQPSSTLIADAESGLSSPIGVAVSNRNGIYVGTSTGTILVLNDTGQIQRTVRCGCMISTMAPLANSAVLLTDRLNQPLFVLDRSGSDQIFFIPALFTPSQGSAQ